MLLFRSEDDVRAWCEQRRTTPGAIFDLARLWDLARTWYDDRLDLNWRRRTIPERQAILDAVGLDGPFWRLTIP
jgi:Alkylmercury lyase